MLDPPAGDRAATVTAGLDLPHCRGAHGLRLHPGSAFIACVDNNRLLRVDGAPVLDPLIQFPPLNRLSATLADAICDRMLSVTARAISMISSRVEGGVSEDRGRKGGRGGGR